MTPTNLNTLPSLNASDLSLSNSWSYPDSFLMNSSPDSTPSKAAGTKDFVLTDLYPSGNLLRKDGMYRERIVSLRATSAPFRSSAGFGSYTNSYMTQKFRDRISPFTRPPELERTV